jgi:hypothetical protein
MTRTAYRYRVNFGNGQVHYPGNRSACWRFVAAHGDGFTFIEWQDPDTAEWFAAGNAAVSS